MKVGGGKKQLIRVKLDLYIVCSPEYKEAALTGEHLIWGIKFGRRIEHKIRLSKRL